MACLFLILFCELNDTLSQAQSAIFAKSTDENSAMRAD